MSVIQLCCSFDGSRCFREFGLTRGIFNKGVNMLSSWNDPELADFNQTSGMKKREKKNHNFLLLLGRLLNSFKGNNVDYPGPGYWLHGLIITVND